MKYDLIASQLKNASVLNMYNRQFLTLAENVFEFGNIPNYIDTAYMNKCLVRKGSIVFFYDEVLETLLALPFRNLGNLDVYGRPNKIEAYSLNGYRKVLNKNEYVIMYDNNGRYPIYLDIYEYAIRMALITRIIDINVLQQKTPRIITGDRNQIESLKAIVNNIDGNLESMITLDNINIEGLNVILEPAPYLSDKLEEEKNKIWSEFLRLIGVSNLSFQKKERNITDEISAMQGGTVASRYSRFEPRQKAVKEINEKFKQYLEKEITVEYYDGIPTTDKEKEDFLNSAKEGEEDVL